MGSISALDRAIGAIVGAAFPKIADQAREASKVL
jgi:hypothetical protein